MGSRSHVAYIDRDGAGKGIYVHMGCRPDDIGIQLLLCYQEEEIKALVNLGFLSGVSDTVERTAHFVYNEDERDRPYTICGGTQEFFGRWLHGIEWLYAWTPDGWLACRTWREGDIPYHQLNDPVPEDSPEWRDNDARAAEYQQPRPLYQVIQDFLELDHPPTLKELRAARR